MRCLRVREYGLDRLDAVESEGRAAILAFFHGRQFLFVPNLVKRRLTVMSSLSRDGELQARTLAGFGYEIVRGSTSRGGIRGFIGMKKKLEQGYHATFAVDGPRGPIYVVKPGVIHLAKRSGAPVIPMATSASPAYVFGKAWDRYLLPLPFSRCVMQFGEPLHFDDDLSPMAVDRDSLTLHGALVREHADADRRAGFDKTRWTEAGE